MESKNVLMAFLSAVQTVQIEGGSSVAEVGDNALKK